MISKQDVENLMSRPVREGSSVLSIYLNIDQSQSDNINRKFEKCLRTMLRNLEHSLDEAGQRFLAQNSERIWRFMADYEPTGRTLVMISDAKDDFFWVRGARVSLPNQIFWNETPHVLPLLKAFEEYQRYGVILTDKNRARLFTVFLGEIEDECGTLAPNDVKFLKSTGRDNLRSQMQLQRTDELHAMWHLKHVIRTMEDLSRRHHFDHLILGGQKEAVHNLYDLLPKKRQEEVVATIPIPMKVNRKRVLDEIMKLERELEQTREAELILSLMQATHKQDNVALGIDRTLSALTKGRIHRLIYCENYRPAGFMCRNCSLLFAHPQNHCFLCEAPVHPIEDLLERIAERVFHRGGKIEQVRGDAAKELQGEGSIGAFLRT